MVNQFDFLPVFVLWYLIRIHQQIRFYVVTRVFAIRFPDFFFFFDFCIHFHCFRFYHGMDLYNKKLFLDKIADGVWNRMPRKYEIIFTEMWDNRNIYLYLDKKYDEIGKYINIVFRFTIYIFICLAHNWYYRDNFFN